MSRRVSTIEWIVAENDSDWERLCTSLTQDLAPKLAPVAHNRSPSKRFAGSMVVFVLALALGSGWWWRTAQAKLPQHEAAMGAIAQLEFGAVMPEIAPSAGRPLSGEWFQHAEDVRDVHAAIQNAASPAELDAVVHHIDVRGDQAVARFVAPAKDGAPAYRQARFYRRTATGWQPTVPDARLWGPAQRVETQSFIFHFRQNDAAAVIAVAPQIEALYGALKHDFGLGPIYSAEKLVIDVSVTQRPGNASWPRTSERFVVASPALYRAPVELTDDKLLAQSLALRLLDHLLVQASRRHATGASWEPVLNGLRLWQVWDMGLPLSVWQEDVVRWIYGDSSATTPRKPLTLPEHYQELCATHKLWMLYPVQIQIPLTCADAVREEAYFTSWHSLGPPTRLEQFALPVSSDPYVEAVSRGNQRTYAGQTISLATVVEYAVVTYGRERLPKLVAGLGQYKTWDTLLPAVFDSSAAEFEAGWQAYLTDRYGVGSPAPPFP
jgi:hypothetical protein